MTAKISYEVIFASSNENGHDAKELEIRNNTDYDSTTNSDNTNNIKNKGKGWQSARFCDFPQDLVIRLDYICEISQIQILSHQSKIASKIEIWVGLDNNKHNYSTYKSINWKRLGYLSLDKNERSNWKARELKSVYINTMANYIKFSLYESHINTINLFNQIGIVALTIMGKKTANNNEINNEINNENIIINNTNINENRNKNNNNNFDIATSKKIRELEILKKQAVENEDYDEAKRCKICIENLRNVSKELFNLEKQKKIAVEKEDYDSAKVLKLQIDRLRSMSLNVNNNSNINISNRQIINRESISPKHIQKHIQQPIIPSANIMQPSHTISQSISPNISMNMNNNMNINNSNISNNNFEERQIRPMKRNYNTIDVNNVNDPFGDNNNSISNNESIINEVPIEESQTHINNSNISNRPPALKPAVKKGSEKLIEMFGEYIICLLNSPNWNHRDEGLKQIIEYLNNKEHINNKLIFKLCCKIIYTALNDRVAGVILAGIDVLNVLINVYNSDNNNNDMDMCKNLHSIVIVLVNILGNNNNRLIDGSGSILISLCHTNDLICKMIYNSLIKKMKKILPKHLKGRGLILLQLIPQFNIPKGIDLNLFMNNLILPQLLNKNGNIRDIGIQIVCLIYQINEYKNKIIYYLENNNNINDFLKETLNKSFAQCCGHSNVLQRAPKSIKEQSRPSKTMNRSNSNSNNNNKTNTKRQYKRHKQMHKKNINKIEQENINVMNDNIIEEEGQEEEEQEDVCNFCGLKDKLFVENEENLDLHYWQSCPMLTSCTLCEQVIEIATLHEHILTECESGIKHEVCQKCHIPYEMNNSNHTCPNNIDLTKAMCPLCLNNINSSAPNAWKIHLLKYPGCKSNPRPLLQ